MAFVRIEDGESIEHALRRFRRVVQRENILRDARRAPACEASGGATIHRAAFSANAVLTRLERVGLSLPSS